MYCGQSGVGLGDHNQQQQNKGILCVPGLVCEYRQPGFGLLFVLQSRAKKIRTVLSTIQILTVKQEIQKMLGEVNRTGALGRKVQKGIMGWV